MCGIAQWLIDSLSFENKERITDCCFACRFRNRLALKVAERSWYVRGTTSDFMDLIEPLTHNETRWRRFGTDIWLQYIASLLEKDRQDEAKEMYGRYRTVFGGDVVRHFFPVARLAVSLGESDKRIVEADRCFNILERNREIFKDTIRGKNVAIVGNGPSELNTGNGERIDGHDIVVRFNNFNVREYRNDYGSRTDIWVTAFSEQSADVDFTRLDLSDDIIIMLRPDIWHTRIDDSLRYLLSNLLAKTKNISYFNANAYQSLLAAAPLWPSSGLICLWTILHEKLAEISAQNLFGFSFQQKVKKKYAEHYFCDKSSAQRRWFSRNHHFINESDFIVRLLESAEKK